MQCLATVNWGNKQCEGPMQNADRVTRELREALTAYAKLEPRARRSLSSHCSA